MLASSLDLFSYRQSVVQPALPEVELGEERTPLVRELGHLPPDALGCLLLVRGHGPRAPGGALRLAGHCNGQGQMSDVTIRSVTRGTVSLPGFVRLNGCVATQSSAGAVRAAVQMILAGES